MADQTIDQFLPYLTTGDITDKTQLYLLLSNLQGVPATQAMTWDQFEASLGIEIITPESRGAKNDGVTDDYDAFLQAIADAGSGLLRLLAGTGYYIGVGTGRNPLQFQNGLSVIGEGPVVSRFVVDEYWTTRPLIELTGAAGGCLLENFSVEETNASPRPTLPAGNDKTSANNVGIRVSSPNNRLRRLWVNGFGFPVQILNTSGDSSRDDNRCEDVTATNGYTWGVEVDSARNCHLIDVRANNNGLDGIKVQNEYSRTCDGLIIHRAFAATNGQRDTNAGGTESTNGGGLDLFTGGFKFSVTDSIFQDNFGAGVVIKGVPPQPDMGLGTFTNVRCDQNRAPSSGSAHGFELHEQAARQISITGGSASANEGWGIRMGTTAAGIKVSGVDIIGNQNNGIQIDGGSDCSVRDCNILGNKGVANIAVGSTNDASLEAKRLEIVGNTISGNYDQSLAAGINQKDAATEWVTEYGIRVYSDSADVRIEGNAVYNHWSRGIYIQGDRCAVRKNYLYQAPTNGIYALVGPKTGTIEENTIEGIIETVAYSTGSGNAPSINDLVTGTGATGRLKKLTVDSGGFATNDAVGTMYLSHTTGQFLAADTVTYPGGSALTTSITSPRPIQVLNGTRFNIDRNTIIDSVAGKTRGFAITVNEGLYSLLDNDLSASGFNVLYDIKAAASPTASYDAARKSQLEDVTFSATPTFKFDDGNFDNKRIVLTANITDITLTATRKGFYEIWFEQDGTGFWTVAPTTTSVSPAILSLPVNLPAGAVTVWRLYYDGTQFLWG